MEGLSVLKILHVCYFELPHYGGLSRYVYTLKKELEDHGHQVDILSHHPGMTKIYKYNYVPNEFGWNLTGAEIDKSVGLRPEQPTIKDVIDHQVYRYYENELPHVDPRIRWREIERYTFEIAAALLNLNEYDLIHTHDILSTRALWRVKPKHIPLVATIHGILATEYLNSGEITSKDSLNWKYAVAEEYYGHLSTDTTIVPTNWQKIQLSTLYGVPAEKIKVIPYGMNLDPFLTQLKHEPYPHLKEEQKNPGKLVIACPARLVPEKDHKTLIEALRILKEKRQDFVCWFIGDGNLRYELELQAKQSGVRENIVFFGARWDVPALLRLSNIVVLPSIQDMHPYTLMEAQVAGKPCVASDAGGIPEVVKHKRTGLIFEKGNSVQLAQSILALMNDTRLRLELAAHASFRGRERYSSQRLFEQTMNIYTQTIETKQSSTQDSRNVPDLSGKYGLVKTRVGQENAVSNIFGFNFDYSKFDSERWSRILECVPTDYSIPDTAFIEVLAEQKEPYMTSDSGREIGS
jgi:glycosyltransferase involved in cell wall biosynthesis